MPYKVMLPTGIFNYYASFRPNVERQLILFKENVKGEEYSRPVASNGTGSLIDLSASYAGVNLLDPSGKSFTMVPDTVVDVFIPKDDPVQNLEGKYRELMALFYRSGYTDFTSYQTAQSLKSFALTQGYSFQQVQAWDIGAFPSGLK